MNYYRDTMDRQDSEPLFGDDIYNLLREDSLLRRTGSVNFASLIDTSENMLQMNQSHLHLPDHPQQQQQQDEQQQNQCVQQLAFTQSISNQVLMISDTTSGYPMMTASEQLEPQPDTPHHYSPDQQQQQQQAQQLISNTPWNIVEETDDLYVIPSSYGQVAQQEEQVSLLDEEEDQSCLAAAEDTSAVCPVPSIQSWRGRYSFTLSVPTDNTDRNKWCYSQMLNKLYLCQNVAVPVNVMLGQWIDATLTVTPVYKDSRYRMDPVQRCIVCKNPQGLESTDPLVEHIVRVEGKGDYHIVNKRNVVRVPLQPPTLGEAASTLLVKLMCLTSCPGGPNRRPFCLVFTLRNSSGCEIGRQVLDVKCCRCPSRDLKHDEKQLNCQDSTTPPTTDDEKRAKIRKLAGEIKVGKKRKRPNIKVEPSTNPGMVMIEIPIELENEVKKFVNDKIAGRIIQQSHPDLLFFPHHNN